MASSTAVARLQREFRELCKDPPPHVRARPDPSNILEWHYILDGPAGTAYSGGQYWGKLVFPPAYPFKPPSVLMLTPSGRFQPGSRICMSMSDYHPESWNPLWSVASILTGLLSFMCDSATTAGSIQTTDCEKSELARKSRAYNARSAQFKKMFSEVAQAYLDESSQVHAAYASDNPQNGRSSPLARRSEDDTGADGTTSQGNQRGTQRKQHQSKSRKAGDGKHGHPQFTWRPLDFRTTAFVSLAAIGVLLALGLQVWNRRE